MIYVYIHFIHAHMSIETTAAPSCSKCGANKKKAGQLSCCVKGGAWFKNCGDPGDSKFDHTWDEGIEACKGKFVFN